MACGDLDRTENFIVLGQNTIIGKPLDLRNIAHAILLMILIIGFRSQHREHLLNDTLAIGVLPYQEPCLRILNGRSQDLGSACRVAINQNGNQILPIF